MTTEARQVRDFCYLSSPSHVHSFVGQFIYIYTDKGELELTGETLRFQSWQVANLVIRLETITDVARGSYSRWAKPLRLDYLAISYREGAHEATVLFTPTRSWLTSVWKTNQMVAKWEHLLRAEVDQRRTHPVSSQQGFIAGAGI